MASSAAVNLVEMGLAVFGCLSNHSNKHSRGCKRIEKENRKRNKTFSKVKHYDNSHVSNKLESECRRMSKGSELVAGSFVDLAEYTNLWIKYAMYYMTHNNTPLVVAGSNEKRLVNAIAKAAGFNRNIYEDEDDCNLDKYDAKSAGYNYRKSFLLLANEVMDRVNETSFQDAMKARMARDMMGAEMLLLEKKESPQINATVSDDGTIHPVWFTNINNVSETTHEKKDPNMDDITFKKFEDVLSGILINQEYWYTKEDNNYYVTIKIKDGLGATDKFLLDDGRIMGGNKVSVLGSYIRNDGIRDTIFVDVDRHPLIAANVLSSKWYNMNAMELDECNNDLFKNQLIYRNIDLSNTDYLYNITAQDKFILNKSLSAAISVTGDIRMRILEYNGPDNIILISDSNCVSLLPGITATEIKDNLGVMIVGKKMVMTYNGNRQSYTINYRQE